MKIVLDSNVLVSGLFFGGVPRAVLSAWQEYSFDIVFSEEIVSEYKAVLSRFEGREKSGFAHDFLALLTRECETVGVSNRNRYSRDRNYVVSGDNDLLVLKKVKDVVIISASDFLKLLKSPM
jgi:predicted nucleic acid-binding protein